MFHYEPKQLSSAKDEIRNNQVRQRARRFSIDGNDAVRNLVTRVNSVSLERLDDFALSLHTNEIEMLCTYIPDNSYNLNVLKSLRVIGRRITKRRFAMFFLSWQDNYNDKYSTMLIKEMAGSDMENELLDQFNLNHGVLDSWLKAESLEQAIIADVRKLGKEFGDGLEWYGIRKDSALGKQCAYLSNSRQSMFRRR